MASLLAIWFNSGDSYAIPCRICRQMWSVDDKCNHLFFFKCTAVKFVALIYSYSMLVKDKPQLTGVTSFHSGSE